MATVRTVTLPDGSTFTMSDWGDYPVWSRAEIDPAASQEILIFNYTASQEIPGGATNARATILDTNMATSGQFALRHQMVVFSVMAKYDELSTADDEKGEPGRGVLVQEAEPGIGMAKWQTIEGNLYFKFVVEQSKPYVEGTLDRFPMGGGLVFSMTDQNTVQSYCVNNGIQGMHAARRLAMPVHLGALETYQGIFQFPRGPLPAWSDSTSTGFGVKIILNGPRQRPIG